MLSNDTSVMAAITTPARWSYEVVDIFFGEVRVRANQTIAMRGDLLRDMDDGSVVEFIGRKGDALIVGGV